MAQAQAAEAASPLTALLKQIEERSDNSLHDGARALLDALDLPATVDKISKLLDWSCVPATCVHARRERCRLVSYAAIMHGAALLPHLPHLVRLLVPLLGDPEALVAEELLRMVGTLSRHCLATHTSGPQLQPDPFTSLLAPIIGGAAGAESLDGITPRARACFLAVHRALVELPNDLLHASAVLPTTHALLQVLTSLGDPPPSEAFEPLTRAAQIIGVHLPEGVVHQLVQSSVTCFRCDNAAALRGAVELLRTLGPMLRAREAEESFARELTRWVADEVALLPEAARMQLAVQDLAAAYATRRAASAEAAEAEAAEKEAAAVEREAVVALAAAEAAAEKEAVTADHETATASPAAIASPTSLDPKTDVELMARMARLEK